MKINWFSPLPPARTDIGHYTLRLLPALAERAEVTLWTTQTDWDRAAERYAEVRHWQGREWAALNSAAMTFYNIGNNRLFHSDIWLISQRHAGVVILHDLCLQHFFVGLYLEMQQDRAAYRTAMERCYGPEGKAAAERFFNGELSLLELAQAYPLTEPALAGAVGGIVHTRAGLAELTRQPHWPVGYAPLPYPVSKVARQATARSPWRLIMFGYMGANRRVDQVLQALAALPERHQFSLDIYGQLDDKSAVEKRLQSLGLQAQVRLHGFVEEKILTQALSEAHLAINLRFPSMGEASGSQLRIWNHALPSLVSQTGWYATLPADTVAFVRPEWEAEDIRRHLQAFLVDPQRFTEMGQAGHRLLAEQHAPARYAQTLLEFASCVQRFRRSALMAPLVQRLGAEMSHFSDTVIGPLMQKAAGEIHVLTCKSLENND